MTDVIDLLLERLWPGRDVRLEPLPGGITNANYLVSFGDERLVLRVAGENTELLGIDRRGETAANVLASSLGIAPEIHARSEHEGWMVTEFLPGRPIPFTEMASDEMLGAVTATLRRIHVAGKIHTSFDPFSIIGRYHDIALSRGVDEPFNYPAAHSVLDRIGSVRPFRPSAFCHNDLLNGNFLYDGEVRILDWEYAGMGDPFFDLANFSTNHDFPLTSDVILLTRYFGRCDDSLLAVLALMKLVSELREAMWGVVQLAVSTLDVDFGAYCQERSNRYEVLLGAMDLDETLHAASTLPSSEPELDRGLD
jgi:thiamine kinase-like enzyme